MAGQLLKIMDTKNYGAETIRVGDLNGDGAYELLFVQSYRPTREISCLTAVNMNAEILWQFGTPSEKNGEIFSDLPVQIYDWDHDGKNEVLWIEQAGYIEPVVSKLGLGEMLPQHIRKEEIRGHLNWVTEQARSYNGHAILHILDGATGQEKARLRLPAPADDCLAFANLTGNSRRSDLIVKDRYWNIWGIDHEGIELWHWQGETGHFPGIADVNGDGLDEIYLGGVLLDHQGNEMWRVADYVGHQDAASIVTANGETRLISIADKLRCHNKEGQLLWSHEFGHGQHVVPGCFRPDLGEIQFAVLDEGEDKQGGDSLHFIDWDGTKLWSRPLSKSLHNSHMTGIRWFGNAECLAVFPEVPNIPVQLYDGYGNMVDELRFRLPEGREPKSMTYVLAADLWGDSREEALLVSREGLNIYMNSDLNPLADLYNTTHYKGY